MKHNFNLKEENKAKTFMVVICSFFLFLFLISFISAELFGFGRTEGVDTLRTFNFTGNLTNFTELQDTPNGYTGKGGQCAKVNGGETALTFGSCVVGAGDNVSWNQSLANSLYVNVDGDNMTGNLTTTSWFNGLFNWTISTASNIWLSFTGSELSFNETHLNASGDDRWVNVDGDNVTGPLDMGNNIISTINSLDFNLTANATNQEGRLTWNDDDKTLNIGTSISDVTLQVGQEFHLRTTNKAGRDLKNGNVVFIDGVQGQRPTIDLAIASNASRARLIGVLTHDCDDNDNCIVTTSGLVRDINTSGFTAGDMLYLSDTEEGNLTNVIPVAPNFPILVAIALNSNSNEGTIFVVTGPTDVVADMVIQGLTINTNLTVSDRIFLKNQNHTFKIGMESPFNGISADTFWFNDNDEVTEGEIVFAFTQENKTIIAGQIGRNNSAGILGNSWMVIPNNLSTNYTFFSDCILVIDSLGITPRIICDTEGEGSDLFVHNNIQLGGTIFAEEGIRAETFAEFIMNGNDLNVFNGTVHIQEPVTFVTGFEVGDTINNLEVNFEGGISPFTNLQTDLGNWIDTVSNLCDEGECAEANGAGLGNVIMQTNFSTLNTNNTELSFVYSLIGLVGSDTFSAVMNNNDGSGDVTIFTDAGTDVTVQQNIDLPVSMENQSVVSLEFICDATVQVIRQCFVDTVKVNGTANLTTTANQSGFDGQICFDDGAKDPNGICLRAIYYNASADEIQFRGNATSITLIDETIINDLTVGGDINVGGNVTATWFLGLINASNVQNNPWIEDTQEGDLNVNSSNFWDNLNTPSDINASDITDDNTYALVAGETFTGDLFAPNLNSSGNLNATKGFFARDVGIGRVATTRMLEVEGAGLFTTGAILGDGTNNGNLNLDADIVGIQQQTVNAITITDSIVAFDRDLHLWRDTDTTERMRLTGGKLGIAIDAPDSFLHALTNDSDTGDFASSDSYLTLTNNDNTNNNYLGINFQFLDATGGVQAGYGAIQVRATDHTAASRDSDFDIFLRNANAINQVLKIKGDGKVGIAVTDPAVFLEVGDVNPSFTTIGNDETIAVGGSTIGRIYVEGSVQADIIMDDSGGSANDQLIQWNIAGGLSKFRSLNDVGTVRAADIIVMDLGTGSVGLSNAAPTGGLEVGVVANTWVGGFPGGGNMIGVGGSSIGGIYLQGTSQAHLILDDSGGGADQQVTQLTQQAETFLLRGVNDAGSAITFNYFVAKSATGNTGTGTDDPLQNVAGGTSDLTGTGFHIKGAGTARGVIEGTAATLEIIDTNTADVDDRIAALINSDGKLWWRSRTQAIGTDIDNIILMDLSNGNVGIGTATPDAKLNVVSTTNVIKINATTAGGDFLDMIGDAGDPVFEFESGGTGGEAVLNMYKDNVLTNVISTRSDTYFNGGNVGIGTQTPQNTLNVVGDINATGQVNGSSLHAGDGFTGQFQITNGDDVTVVNGIITDVSS